MAYFSTVIFINKYQIEMDNRIFFSLFRWQNVKTKSLREYHIHFALEFVRRRTPFEIKPFYLFVYSIHLFIFIGVACLSHPNE